ncbi:transporter, CPA2 family [Filimonas lacunae]|uniref:Transporter, CPA2 family n=1 Tax=Filimonas lacunae TaxID=477680 RepID=A0A173MFT7_9BACT|nr:cation:proton antiporter [Filimonas lacunae]BAV06298.1 glutathione-regulated potassium-efflux system protein KefB [Filimonas lacunae]SIT25705.1 transporter, CPA2 family [Filimonas lacunae]
MNNILFSVSILCLAILLLIFLLKKLHQPYLVAYILAGIVLGPYVSGIFHSAENISTLGEMGIIFLMFFLGLEIEVPDNKSILWKACIAQLIKTALSLLCAFFITKWFGWHTGNFILLAVILTFNSTAVVSEFLRRNGELSSDIGKTVLNILLLQDIMLAPVFTCFQWMEKGNTSFAHLLPAIAGCVLIFFLLRAVRNRNLFQLTFLKEIKKDHELQVFAGGFVCLGFALLAASMGLTGAIGSFIAGIYLSRTDVFNWLESALRPFKIFFVALFFVSIGLMLDIHYIKAHYSFIIAVTVLVMIINSLLSAIVFKWLRFTWKDSFQAGALLAQTGEFGLLACTVAFQLNIIDIDFFKTALSVMGLSLLLSSIWITLLRKVTGIIPSTIAGN